MRLFKFLFKQIFSIILSCFLCFFVLPFPQHLCGFDIQFLFLVVFLKDYENLNINKQNKSKIVIKNTIKNHTQPLRNGAVISLPYHVENNHEVNQKGKLERKPWLSFMFNDISTDEITFKKTYYYLCC